MILAGDLTLRFVCQWGSLAELLALAACGTRTCSHRGPDDISTGTLCVVAER